jgi:hypothetical protein
MGFRNLILLLEEFIMLTKTIKATDFDGKEYEETLYFNLTESELMELELGTEGGFTKMLQNSMNKNNVPALMKAFKEILLKSYGEKSADGRRFIKSDKITEDFLNSASYDAIYMELITNADAASAFINGVVPKKLSEKAKTKEVQDQLKNRPAILSR